MMKRLLFVSLASASILLTGCSESSTDTPQLSSVSFTSYIGANTRASIRRLEQVHSDGFNVIAVQHAGSWVDIVNANLKVPNFMYNQHITWDAGQTAYTYSPLKYWPSNGDNISFFAYSPTVEATPSLSSSSNSEANNPYLVYNTPAASSDQIDLIISKAMNYGADSNPEGMGYDGPGYVYLNFGHSLSKIGFAAKLKEELEEGTSVQVTSLKFYYADEEGSTPLVNKGTLYLDSDSWNLDNTSHFAVTGTGIELSNGSTLVASASSYTAINCDDAYMMFIPQVYQQGAMYATIDYQVTYKDPADPSAEVEVLNTVSNRKMMLPAITDGANKNIGWKMNKSYTYTIEIGLTAIKFDEPSTDDWTDGNPQPTNTSLN